MINRTISILLTLMGYIMGYTYPRATCWILQSVIFMISWLIKHQLVGQAATLVGGFQKNEDRLSLAKNHGSQVSLVIPGKYK
jgi:hypothetical protein